MVVSVEPTWNMKTALALPWASRVTFPTDSKTELALLYRPGVKVRPLIVKGRTAAPVNPSA